jgi:hypothetical protein
MTTSGISSPITAEWTATFLPITLDPKTATYSILYSSFDWGVAESKLRDWSGEALKAFNGLRIDIGKSVQRAGKAGQPLVAGLTLDEATCAAHLRSLARYGYNSYWGFFDDADARQVLAGFFDAMVPAGVPTPTFVSDALLFPWEVLFDGEDYDLTGVDELASRFWGFRYAPARVLNRQPATSVKPQDATPNMLFCLHRSLRQAHEREWPAIQRLIAAVCSGQVHLLSSTFPPAQPSSGRQLLNYLKNGEHNMIHFACHAEQGSAGEDVLRLTPIDPAELGELAGLPAGPDGFGLATDDFLGPMPKFKNIKPLVMLNACQTVDSSDELRVYYNLPQAFIDSGAAAVVATACPVPDVFAAEFARVFYEYFLAGVDPLTGKPAVPSGAKLPIGEALRRTRLYFMIKHRNPLGLAYGLYSFAHYKVASAPAAGGATT